MLSNMFDAPALIYTRRYHWFRQQLNKITTETEHEDAAKFYDSMYGIDLEGLMVLPFSMGMAGKEDQVFLPHLLAFADRSPTDTNEVKLKDFVQEIAKLR